MALFIRFFVVIFGLFFAALAAGAVLVFATLPPDTFDAPFDRVDWLILWGSILTSAAIVSAIAFVPAVVVILIAEALAFRSLFFYALAGGIGGLAYGLTFPAAAVANTLDRTTEITLAAGAAAGIAYWLVAGRTAGLWRGNSVQSADYI
ncbi:MAG TPA: hypothetical protein VKT73_00830 [Xanthobacteraceae bacterium]|nr:hypothetical protein [Xanthobacteraceae bacterium]